MATQESLWLQQAEKVSVLEYVLDGLEKALELERELGRRTVEIDRSFLNADADSVPRPTETSRSTVTAREVAAQSVKEAEPVVQAKKPSEYDFVFLHDRPLSAGGIEMMAKIIQAMGKTADTAPIIIAPPIPKAKIYVVLGGLAMRRFMPGMNGEPGRWLKSPGGKDVLVTYSPEYILRFSSVTATMKQVKENMWRSLKAVKQRIG